MVECDGREYGHHAVGNVCGVPLATHAGLDDGNVDRSVGESRKSENGEHLKEGQSQFALGLQLGIDHLHVGLDVNPIGHKILIADGLPINLNALVE